MHRQMRQALNNEQPVLPQRSFFCLRKQLKLGRFERRASTMTRAPARLEMDLKPLLARLKDPISVIAPTDVPILPASPHHGWTAVGISSASSGQCPGGTHLKHKTSSRASHMLVLKNSIHHC
eukprot:6210651-Pleurochrysis_carterae.AAC.3